MSSFFESILDKNRIKVHDGRALWMYELSEEELNELKKNILNNPFRKIDRRDVTLYFAEWWSKIYDGGSPSIESVYNSLKQNEQDALPFEIDDFFNFAKLGLRVLGVESIRGHTNNQLWFRTLLSQGGLPIKYLKAHQNDYNKYINFLKKLIDYDITNVTEIEEYDEITIMLPLSSRNYSIYESCLELIRALKRNDENYLEIFEKKGGEAFRRINNELKEHIEKREINIRRIRFRANWFLEKCSDTSKIYLEFSYPNLVTEEDFRAIFGVNAEALNNRYNLYYDEIKVCEFKKNINGNFIVSQVNNSIKWNGENSKPNIYMQSKNERMPFDLSILTVDYPDLSEPTMWIEKGENKWKLHKGKNYNEDIEVLVIYDKSWKFDEESLQIEEVQISNHDYNSVIFKGVLTFSNDVEQFTYKTNTPSFEWLVSSISDEWLLSSNLPIVRDIPAIRVFNKDGEALHANVYFQDNMNAWINNPRNCNLGFNKFKISFENTEEYGYFYNIGNLGFEFSSNSLDESIIKFTNSSGFSFQIEGTELITSKIENQSIKIKLDLDKKKFPKYLKLKIEKNGQNRKLIIQLNPPFKGALIADPNGNILENGQTLIIDKLAGFRLISKSTEGKNFIEIVNPEFDNIKIRKAIVRDLNPLVDFEESINSLFKLSNPMNKDSKVTISLIDVRNSILNTYNVKNHNTLLKYENDINNCKMNLIDINSNLVNNLSLFCIPLDISNENIELLQIHKSEQEYIFDENIFSIFNKFIVFSDWNANEEQVILPCFVNRGEKETILKKHDERIIENIEKLSKNEPNSWKKALKYFKLCNSYNLPYSTFDVLSAGFSTPELASKMICLLSAETESEKMGQYIKVIEDDMGISFLWISNYHWNDAFNWLNKFDSQRYNNEIIVSLKENLYILISFYLNEEFKPIFDYAFNGARIKNINFPIRIKIQEIRGQLNDAVLNGLPNLDLEIPNKYNHLLPFNEYPDNLQFLLKCPLKVALTLREMDGSIWNLSQKDEKIRRNILYVSRIAPNWYSQTIQYLINQL